MWSSSVNQGNQTNSTVWVHFLPIQNSDSWPLKDEWLSKEMKCHKVSQNPGFQTYSCTVYLLRALDSCSNWLFLLLLLFFLGQEETKNFGCKILPAFPSLECEPGVIRIKYDWSLHFPFWPTEINFVYYFGVAQTFLKCGCFQVTTRDIHFLYKSQ